MPGPLTGTEEGEEEGWWVGQLGNTTASPRWVAGGKGSRGVEQGLSLGKAPLLGWRVQAPPCTSLVTPTPCRTKLGVRQGRGTGKGWGAQWQWAMTHWGPAGG